MGIVGSSKTAAVLVQGLGTLLTLVFLVSVAAPAPAAERLVVIGTAPVAGLYYPAGGAICRQVNAGRERHGLRCLVESTGGSAENLERLRKGELDLAIVQSDWQYYAARRDAAGTDSADNGPANVDGSDPRAAEAATDAAAGLRALFSLYSQAITVVAAPEAAIATLADLEGRRVALGPPGSAIRAANLAALSALGWEQAAFDSVDEPSIAERVEALCNGDLDAFVLPASHPNGAVAAAIRTCDARLVPIDGKAAAELVVERPFYVPAQIPVAMYGVETEAVPTVGLKATVVATDATPEEVVYQLVKSVFDSLDTFVAQHPVLADLVPEEMVDAGNTAPFHAGARRYYRERGWM